MTKHAAYAQDWDRFGIGADGKTKLQTFDEYLKELPLILLGGVRPSCEH